MPDAVSQRQIKTFSEIVAKNFLGQLRLGSRRLLTLLKFKVIKRLSAVTGTAAASHVRSRFRFCLGLQLHLLKLIERINSAGGAAAFGRAMSMQRFAKALLGSAAAAVLISGTIALSTPQAQAQIPFIPRFGPFTPHHGGGGKRHRHPARHETRHDRRPKEEKTKDDGSSGKGNSGEHGDGGSGKTKPPSTSPPPTDQPNTPSFTPEK